MRNHVFKWLPAVLLCLLLPLVCIAQSSDVIQYLAEGSEHPALNVDHLFEVHVISASTSDSILLRAGGQTILVDCSTSSRANLVIQYLTELGITKLDYAFLTHTHSDHMGGFHRVLPQIPVDQFLRAPYAGPDSSEPTEKLYGMLRARRIPVKMVENETEMHLGDVKLKFLQWQDPTASKNNRSMIIHAQFGKRSILLGADIEGKGQKAIADAYGFEISADLLKVPHHGIVNYQKDFWEAVQPKLALVTSSPERISLLKKKLDQDGIEQLFTSNGNIVAVTDGEIWQVWQQE